MNTSIPVSQPLTDRVVVVPGGTGNVGEGIVRALLTAGATVVVPSRSAGRLAELTRLIGAPLNQRLAGIGAMYGTFAAAGDLAEQVLARFGRIDDVVAAVGGWWGGKSLSQIDDADWAKVFIDPATTHMALVRAFVPRLPDGGTYTSIAGFSALNAYAGSGLVSMQGAAQLMMREVLSAELHGRLRVNELMLGPIINRSRPSGGKSWLTADQVGSVITHVLSETTVADARLDVQDLDRMHAVLGTNQPTLSSLQVVSP